MTIDKSRNFKMGCEGKVSFRTLALAQKAANRRGGRTPYRCLCCGCYHVGNADGFDGRKDHGGKRKRWRR